MNPISKIPELAQFVQSGEIEPSSLWARLMDGSQDPVLHACAWVGLLSFMTRDTEWLDDFKQQTGIDISSQMPGAPPLTAAGEDPEDVALWKALKFIEWTLDIYGTEFLPETRRRLAKLLWEQESKELVAPMVALYREHKEN